MSMQNLAVVVEGRRRAGFRHTLFSETRRGGGTVRGPTALVVPPPPGSDSLVDRGHPVVADQRGASLAGGAPQDPPSSSQSVCSAQSVCSEVCAIAAGPVR